MPCLYVCTLKNKDFLTSNRAVLNLQTLKWIKIFITTNNRLWKPIKLSRISQIFVDILKFLLPNNNLYAIIITVEAFKRFGTWTGWRRFFSEKTKGSEPYKRPTFDSCMWRSVVEKRSASVCVCVCACTCICLLLFWSDLGVTWFSLCVHGVPVTCCSTHTLPCLYSLSLSLSLSYTYTHTFTHTHTHTLGLQLLTVSREANGWRWEDHNSGINNK